MCDEGLFAQSALTKNNVSNVLMVLDSVATLFVVKGEKIRQLNYYHHTFCMSTAIECQMSVVETFISDCFGFFHLNLHLN